MEINVSLKFQDKWESLKPCENVLDVLEIEETILEKNSLVPSFSSANISLKLEKILLNKFLQAPEKIPCMVFDDEGNAFGGILENVCRAKEIRLESESSIYKVNFKIKSWSSWFDFSLKEVFNPYANLPYAEPLYICNSDKPQESLLHKLFDFLGCPFLIKRDLFIVDKSFSFVIKEKENVLDALKELFYSLGRYFYISPAGLFDSQMIDISKETSENIKEVFCVSGFEWAKRNREYDDVKVEYASVMFKSKDLLKAEKKSIYGKSGQGLDKEGKLNPLITLTPQGDYPRNSADNKTFIKPEAEFLQSHYTIIERERAVFGTKGKENKDLSIISLSNPEISCIREKDIDQVYFDVRSDSFAFSFKNILPIPEEGGWESSFRKIFTIDVYADVLYRIKRHFLEVIPLIPPPSVSAPSFQDITIRKKRQKQEIFLKYVQEKPTALNFLALHYNHIQEGNLSFIFQSEEKLELGKRYTYATSENTFTFLIVSRTFKKQSILFSYEATSVFPVFLPEYTETQEEGTSEDIINEPEYTVSNVYDKLNSYLKTDYRNDEDDLSSFDTSASVLNARLTFITGIFFVASHNFRSFTFSKNGAILRKRPLSIVTFEQLASSVKIKPRSGLFIKGNIGSQKEFKTGNKVSIFNWS